MSSALRWLSGAWGCGRLPAVEQWRGVIRATAALQTKREASRFFGEPMAGGGGRASLIIRRMARQLDPS